MAPPQVRMRRILKKVELTEGKVWRVFFFVIFRNTGNALEESPKMLERVLRLE